MRRSLILLTLMLACSTEPAVAQTLTRGEPDYSAWNRLLDTYYNPARGMDYAGLEANDRSTLLALRDRLGRVDVSSLTDDEALAYWINVYNVNTVATITENYPVASIRDLSTDPIIRLNVFKKKRVPAQGRSLSLNDVENEKIRASFKDPRIHFVINCAARSCPPMRREAITGTQLNQQLDDQTRQFMNGPLGARLQGQTLRVTKILDWFGEDFERWGGGKVNFVAKYLDPQRRKQLIDAGRVRIAYDDYDWRLNDWKR